METVANIVVVVVDAFGSHYLKKGDKCILPFLSEAKSKGVSLGRAYSLAPFTEAALVGLLGQEGTFENGGYLFANKNVAFSFAERFSSRGFQVVSAYSPYICSDSYLRGAKEFFYTRFYGIHPLLDYRLRQYSEWMNFENKDHILHICTILLSDVFVTWKKQLES